MTSAQEKEPFDWGPLGEAWWLNAVREAGATLALGKFTAAKQQRCSNTEAGRRAGLKGGTQAGYRAFRSNGFQRLSALVAAETGEGVGLVDATQARMILSKLAIGADPSIRIRAIEALAKMDERETEARRGEEEFATPEATLRAMIRCAGPYGALSAVGTYLRAHQTLIGFPLAEQVLPLVASEFPDSWEKLRRNIVPQHHLMDIDKLASGPVASAKDIAGAEGVDARAQPVAEIGSDAATGTMTADEAAN